MPGERRPCTAATTDDPLAYPDVVSPVPWSSALTLSPPPAPPGADYIDTPLAVIMALGIAATAWCLVVGLRGLAPGRYTFAVVAVLDLALIAFLGIFVGRSIGGEESVGPLWELWAYLVTLVLLPVLGVIWARQERTRWSAFVLAVACLVAWVMAARTNQVWYGVGIG